MTRYQTQSGKPARIISRDSGNIVYPVVAMIDHLPYLYTVNLRCAGNPDLDLVPLPDPIWDEAPDWANFRATDASGTTHWYEERPEVYTLANQWIPTSGAYLYVLLPDDEWQSSLIERPKP